MILSKYILIQQRKEVLIKHGELKENSIIKEEEEEPEESEDTKINEVLEIC